jgi:hypothetical protein
MLQFVAFSPYPQKGEANLLRFVAFLRMVQKIARYEMLWFVVVF